MINVHASLLPKWRGAAPIIHSILNGDKTTGVTIMKIRPYKFDIGEIIDQCDCEIEPDDTTEKLTKKLALIGGELLLKVIKNLPKSLENARPQPTEGISYAPKISPSFSQINWSKMSANYIYNLDKAIGHVYPLKTNFQGKKIVLMKPYLTNTKSEEVFGKINFDIKTKSISVVCSDFNLISFNIVRVEKKKKMSPIEFFNGYLNKFPYEKWKFS